MKPITSILLTLLLTAPWLAVTAQESNSDTALNPRSFDIVWRNNIFNATRVGPRPIRPRGMTRNSTRILYHGPAYDNGEWAGMVEAPGVSHAVKLGDVVQGLVAAKIGWNYICLTNSSTSYIIDQTTSLWRDGEGPWQKSGGSSSASASAPAAGGADETVSSPSSASGPSRPETPTEKKMRLRREQE